MRLFRFAFLAAARLLAGAASAQSYAAEDW